MKNSSNAVLVVLDTNIWVEQPLLRTVQGSALLHAVRELDAKIGMPEVVEMEIYKITVNAARIAVSQTNSALDTLKYITGSRSLVDLPTEDAVREEIENRMVELDDFIFRLPFTLDVAKRSLRKVVDEISPNSKNREQFRDTAIWESIIDQANRFDIYFVTKDTDYYEGRKFENGLALALAKEAGEKGMNLCVFSEIGPCIEKLRAEMPSMDKSKLLTLISASIEEHTTGKADDRGFQIGEIEGGEIKAFFTEDPDKVALDFSVIYRLEDLKADVEVLRDNATLKIDGSCAYIPSTNEIKEFLPNSDHFAWTENEEAKGSKNVYARVGGISLFTGSRSEEFRIRSPLEGFPSSPTEC